MCECVLLWTRRELVLVEVRDEVLVRLYNVKSFDVAKNTQMIP